ncbi:MAG: DUF997 family protein [Streptosporangiales bacterium]|nr:DUF997 family protein [Streptosporangiales bacterium]
MGNQPPRTHEGWTEDPRYSVSNREFVITAAFFVVYTVVTIGVAWLLGGGKDADEIGIVWGFPAWFFWSTLVLGAAFCVVPYFIVRYLFTDMSLEADPEELEDEGAAR